MRMILYIPVRWAVMCKVNWARFGRKFVDGAQFSLALLEALLHGENAHNYVYLLTLCRVKAATICPLEPGASSVVSIFRGVSLRDPSLSFHVGIRY